MVCVCGQYMWSCIWSVYMVSIYGQHMWSVYVVSGCGQWMWSVDVVSGCDQYVFGICGRGLKLNYE